MINLAARAGVRQSVENPWVYMDTNMTGTLNLLELCRQQGIPKFILASTSSIYGANRAVAHPGRMPAATTLCSRMQPARKAPKRCAIPITYLYGIDVTVFRYFTVYGPPDARI